MQKVKQKEIDRLNEMLAKSIILKEKLAKKVENHKKFHTYLEKVNASNILAKYCVRILNALVFFIFIYLVQMIEKTNDFQEIHEIINRFETLHTNQRDLLARQKVNEKQLRAERKEFYAYSEVAFFLNT